MHRRRAFKSACAHDASPASATPPPKIKPGTPIHQAKERLAGAGHKLTTADKIEQPPAKAEPVFVPDPGFKPAEKPPLSCQRKRGREDADKSEFELLAEAQAAADEFANDQSPTEEEANGSSGMTDEQVEREAAMAAEAGKTTASQPGKGTDAPPPVPPESEDAAMAWPSVSHEQFIAHAMSISPHRNARIDFSRFLSYCGFLGKMTARASRPVRRGKLDASQHDRPPDAILEVLPGAFSPWMKKADFPTNNQHTQEIKCAGFYQH